MSDRKAPLVALVPQPASGPTPVLGQLNKIIQIDEEGYFFAEGLRVADAEYGAFLFKSLFIDAQGRAIIQDHHDNILVEYFDEPLIVKKIERPAHDLGGDEVQWLAHFPYGYTEFFDLKTLKLDEWDRFHGRTARNVPFVFSREAQAEFFELTDDYDDESVIIDGQRIETPPLLTTAKNVGSPDYWTSAYNDGRDGWEMNKPSPALISILPKLKLNPLRILILGAGSANDAAYLAEQGHIVTAIDFSAEAIARAKTKFGDVRNLRFLQMDFFALPPEMNGTFDLVFEHTCYCAIDPQKRAELVKVWRRLLSPDGYILGIFFVIDRPLGPPFGASEWELRARFGKGFRSLYWLRLHAQSDESRYGMELLIYSQMITLT